MSQLTIQPIINAVERLEKYVCKLDSAREEVRRLNRCPTFAVPFDWRVDPNTKLSTNLIDSYVELFMSRI